MTTTKTKTNLSLGLKCLLYPGFALLLLGAPLLRGLFFPGDLLPYQVFAGALMVFFAADIVLSGGERVFGGALTWGFLLLAAAYGVSTFGAVAKADAVRGFLKHLLYFGVFLVSAHLSRTKRARNALVLVIFLAATAVAAVGVLSATGLLVFPGAAEGGRIMSTLQYPNALAAYLMFSSIIGISLAGSVRNLIGRAAVLGTFLQTVVFLASYSRGGWVIYPFTLVALFVGLPRERRSRTAFDICAILSAVLLVVRGFAESIASKTPGRGLWYLGVGFLIVCVFYAGRWIWRIALSDRISPQAGRALTWAAGLYATATFALYIFLMASQHNAGLAGVVPASILDRLSTISIDDPSLITRAFSTRDALAIFADRPFLGGGAGAWNALYHQYQRVLYWTTEVHNHFAQILVETGVFGFLPYALIWVSALYSGAKYCFRKDREAPFERDAEQDADRALAWGLLTAALAMGAHSAMDFELSLPGIAIQLWAVFGILWGIVDRRTEAEVVPQRHSTFRRLGAALLVLCAAAGILVPSYRYIQAAEFGRLGAVALMRQDFHNAVGLYDEAQALDPLTADYALDKAQACAAMYVFNRSPNTKEQALSALLDANRLEPLNLTHRMKEVEVLMSLGETGRAVEVSRRLTEMLPLDIRAYEVFARSAVIAAMNELGEDGLETPSDDIQQVSTLLDEVVSLPDTLESLRKGITGVFRERWNPDNLLPSSVLKNYIGQAYYLKGDIDGALSYLSEASKAGDTRREASLWLEAAFAIKDGIPVGRGVSQEVLQIMSYFRRMPVEEPIAGG